MNDKYMGYEGIALEMARFFKGGATPVSAAETLEVFAFMEAAHESKRKTEHQWLWPKFWNRRKKGTVSR